MRFPSLTRSLVALAALLVVGAPGAGSASAATWEEGLIRVVSPRDDQLVRGGSVRVRLRLAPGATLRRAYLNGTDVRRQFKRRGRAMVGELSVKRNQRALRKGRNFLHLIVGRGGRHGRVSSETISFTRVVESRKLLPRFRVGHQARRGLRSSVEPSRPSARLRASLNGSDVSDQYRAGKPLRRWSRLGADDGLRHGANRLRVLVFDFHGGYTTRTRTVRVGPQTTIAGAGRDLRVRAGRVVRLDGRASQRALHRDGAVRRGKLRFRWRLVRKPHGSRARLSRADQTRPILRTDLPGAYRVELRTSQPSGGVRRTTSIDIAEVTAKPQPTVPVSTFAEAGGVSGIEVGVSRDCAGRRAAAKPPCFYPNPGNASDLQVVVLNRETLEPISNTAYDPSDLSQFAAAMAKLGTKLEPAGGQKCLYAYDTEKLV